MPVAMRRLTLSSCLCLVLVLALGLPSLAWAQSPTPIPAVDGLFLSLGGDLSTEVRGALTGSVQGDGRVPAGVLRSRRVAMDVAILNERVLGFLERPGADPVQDQAPLLLNFFDDTTVVVLVDAVEPAVLGNGYVVTGSVQGQPGSVVLVVHSDSDDRVGAVSGSASTADGAFRVSTVGGGIYSIEEIDATVPWVDDVLPGEPELADPPLPPSPDAGGAAFSLVDPTVSAASSGVSEIDVLVLYTPAAAAQAGGEASMRAEIERLFGETNTAFRNSGVSARVSGWARAVSYVESQNTSTNLNRLQGRFDGHLDDVHSMRSDLGADLVHLLVAFTPTQSSDGSFTCGSAYNSVRSSFAFGVTLFSRQCSGHTFTHELGHNLGLSHDRYQNFTYGTGVSARVPYAYGYSNAATFSPGAGGQCWYTVMAYYKHCYDVPGGRSFTVRVLLFSSPYNRHPASGEPLGVLGEVETHSIDGPANTARALESASTIVVAYYHRPDPPAVTGVDLTAVRGTVSVSPVVVDVGESVSVQALVVNIGLGFVSSSTVSFWSKHDEPGAEWVNRASTAPGSFFAGASKTVTWSGTGGSSSGTEFWAVCITASGDVNSDNDCAVSGETVVIRDPDAIDGGQLVTESSGELDVGATAEIEFAVNDVTGDTFQIQPHWFLLSYEPVDAVVWGAIYKWGCYEDDWSDCWNTDGTENTAADWDWRRRAGGFGSDGSFVTLLGLEAYSWSDADKWRFMFSEATSADEEPDTEISWRFGALRVTDDSGSSEAVNVFGTGVGGLSPGGKFRLPVVKALQLPRALQDVFRRSRPPR